MVARQAHIPGAGHDGDGRGGIRAAYDLGVASDRTRSGRLVDLDGDGALDVVISNDRPDPKLVYLNDGKGRFRVGSTFGRPEWSTRNASVADINGDRLPDIVVGNVKAPGVIHFNDGAGQRFTPVPFGDGQGTAYGLPSTTWIATGGWISWWHGRRRPTSCISARPARRRRRSSRLAPSSWRIVCAMECRPRKALPLTGLAPSPRGQLSERAALSGWARSAGPAA